MRMIRKGDIVKIKPEWRDAGDEDVRFVATEDEDGGRIKIEAQLGLTINPQLVVSVEMIEKKGLARRSPTVGKTCGFGEFPHVLASEGGPKNGSVPLTVEGFRVAGCIG